MAVVKNIIKHESFSSAATQFGIDNEPHALQRCESDRKLQGDNISLSQCGFIVHPVKGFLGASPDGRVTEQGGTEGIVEVKCPSKWSKSSIEEAAKMSSYPLKAQRRQDGEITYKLKPNHHFYHQVQLQLACAVFATFCDFVIFHVESRHIHVERIPYFAEYTRLPK